MKTSLFKNVLFVSLFAVLAISCGKDSKKSSNNGQNYYNPYLVGSTATSSGATAQAALQNYINAIETKTNIQGVINVQKGKYSCKDGHILGISFLPYQNCSYSQGTTEPVYVYLNMARGTIHPALANVLVSPAGYTLGNIIQYGNVVVVEHVMGVETIQYVVDMSLHAASNPYQVKDSAAKRIDYVLSPF